MLRVCLVLLAGLALAACERDGPPPDAVQAPAELSPRDMVASVEPADFALIPCSKSEKTLCFLAMAGGKRLLFGAPAGIGNRFAAKDLAALDGLFLFSLRPEDIEGLDEVRNVSWQAGRPDMLAVTGPHGVTALIDAINRAYEVSDALIFVEDGAPAGGFDAALLMTNQEVDGKAIVFDTGDLQVRAASDGGDRVGYHVAYRDMAETWHELLIQPCGAPDADPGVYETAPADRGQIICTETGYNGTWPFTTAWFLEKFEE